MDIKRLEMLTLGNGVFELNEKSGKQGTPGADLGQILNLERELSVLEQSIADAKGELEHLQAELLHTRQEEEEAKALAKSILEETEKKEEALREKRNELEGQCADLSVKSKQMTDDLDIKSKELLGKSAQLEDIKRQGDLIRRGRKHRFVFTAVMIFLLGVMFFGYVGFRAKVADLNEDITEWKNLCQSTATEKADALAKLSEMRGYAGSAMVRVNRVYNADEEGRKISDDLKASEMRYLHYDFDLLFLEDVAAGTVIYVDLYYPDGSLKHSSSSPPGHTTSYDVYESCNVSRGWGNASKSIYTAGLYRMDLVYEDRIICSKKIEISD